MNYSIAMVFFYLLLQMCLVWGAYRLLKNPSVVDASWSFGIMCSGLIYLVRGPTSPRSLVISALLILWSLRLAGYLLYTRIFQGHVDKRYSALSNSWKINQSLGFFLNFQLQGLLIFVISFVFFLIAQSNNANLDRFDVFAVVVILIGIVGESIADWQLRTFKTQEKGGVCTMGLWHYSRHPNYFFDWLTFVGFALFGLQSNKGYFGIISPLLLYYIFTRITGPLTELGSVQSRGQPYIDYQSQTSMFFPWVKKHNYFK
jgi:steroid 5-alpha reductase family enzyme